MSLLSSVLSLPETVAENNDIVLLSTLPSDRDQGEVAYALGDLPWLGWWGGGGGVSRA